MGPIHSTGPGPEPSCTSIDRSGSARMLTVLEGPLTANRCNWASAGIPHCRSKVDGARAISRKSTRISADTASVRAVALSAGLRSRPELGRRVAGQPPQARHGLRDAGETIEALPCASGLTVGRRSVEARFYQREFCLRAQPLGLEPCPILYHNPLLRKHRPTGCDHEPRRCDRAGYLQKRERRARAPRSRTDCPLLITARSASISAAL